MFIKNRIRHGIAGAKPTPSSANLKRMNTAEIANEFIESKESMNSGTEVGESFVSKGLMTRAQGCRISSVMRVGSEANP
jgi:hypothetical protein